MLVESFCRLAMDPSGNSVPQKLCNSSHDLSFSLSNRIPGEVSSVFYLAELDNNLTSAVKRFYLHDISKEKMKSWESRGRLTSLCNLNVFRVDVSRYLQNGLDVRPVWKELWYRVQWASVVASSTTTYLQALPCLLRSQRFSNQLLPWAKHTPGDPVGPLGRCRLLHGWSFEPPPFFFSCYDDKSLESRIFPPWWSTTIWRRIAHTTCILYGVAAAFPAANVEHFRHLWSKIGYLGNALSFNTKLWWCQGLHPFLKPW